MKGGVNMKTINRTITSYEVLLGTIENRTLVPVEEVMLEKEPSARYLSAKTKEYGFPIVVMECKEVENVYSMSVEDFIKHAERKVDPVVSKEEKTNDQEKK